MTTTIAHYNNYKEKTEPGAARFNVLSNMKLRSPPSLVPGEPRNQIPITYEMVLPLKLVGESGARRGWGAFTQRLLARALIILSSAWMRPFKAVGYFHQQHGNAGCAPIYQDGPTARAKTFTAMPSVSFKTC